MKITKNKKGFSLVELLVAMAIFAIISILFSTMFLTITNNQRRSKISQEILNNAQYALELMSREVKNNELIAFSNNPCLGLGEPYNDTCLLFVRQDGQTAGFGYDSANKKLAYMTIDCTRSGSEYGDCEVSASQEPIILLSSDYNNVDITSLSFDIKPISNPYYYDYGQPGFIINNQHPRVTINLAINYQGTRPIENVSHILQTTVSSRVYKR